jgi:hypothetical protein
VLDAVEGLQARPVIRRQKFCGAGDAVRHKLAIGEHLDFDTEMLRRHARSFRRSRPKWGETLSVRPKGKGVSVDFIVGTSHTWRIPSLSVGRPGPLRKTRKGGSQKRPRHLGDIFPERRARSSGIVGDVARNRGGFKLVRSAHARSDSIFDRVQFAVALGCCHEHAAEIAQVPVQPVELHA